MPGRFRAVVFDMDGVLVDSERLWIAAETDLLARHGRRFTADDAAATHGRSLEDSIAAYADRLGMVDPDALKRELMAAMRDRYDDGVPARPGARELVRWLGGRMLRAVASNTDGALVRLALERIGLLDAFEAIASGSDVSRGKPYPDVYLAACAMLRVAPADAVAIEDSPAGVVAAKAAGLACIGVPDRPGVDLGAAGADWIVTSLADLIGSE